MSVCQLSACKFVRFVLKPLADLSTTSTATQSAFDVMTERAEQVVLPDKVCMRDGAELRGDKSLHNAVLDVLASMNIGCSPDVVGSV